MLRKIEADTLISCNNAACEHHHYARRIRFAAREKEADIHAPWGNVFHFCSMECRLAWLTTVADWAQREALAGVSA